MTIQKRRLLGSVSLAVATALAAAGAAAAEPVVDTSNWKCEHCPFFTGYDADAELGGLVASGANASYGHYTGIDQDHGYVDAAAKGLWRSAEGGYVHYDLERLGLASRDGTIEAGSDGRYAVRLAYDGQPARLYDSTVTPFQGAGSGALTLPAGWVNAGTTGSMTALGTSLAPVKLEYDRRTAALSARYFAGSGWTFYGELSRHEKDGTGLIGASFLTQAVQLPRPVDYVTTGFEAGVRWVGSRASLQLGYSGSRFQDQTSTLSFANPYLPIAPGSTEGRLALPPDNELQQLSAAGEVLLPYPATMLTFNGSVGRLRQTDAFLPLSTLPGSASLAAGSLDGEVRLTHYALGLSSRPLPKLYLRGSASYDGRDDRSPVITTSYVATDTFPAGTATAVRYGQDRMRLEGSADYRLAGWLRIGIGGSFKSSHYAPGQVAVRTDDGQGWIHAVATSNLGLTLTLKGGGSTRKASPFDASALPANENPLVRAYNVAPRDRTFYSVSGSWPVAPTVTWSFEGFLANDDYRLSPLGLQSVHERRASTTLSYAPQERMSLYIDAGYQLLDSLQSGFTGAFTPPWQFSDRQRYWNVGAGAHVVLRERWDLTLDYVHAPSDDSSGTLALGLAQAFPDNSTQLDALRFDLRYKMSTALSLHLRYAHEKYDSGDWALAGVGPATIPNLLALGRSPYYHHVDLFGLSVQYRFGQGAAPPVKAD
jgi:MtrB/PioB family decaheme-associated outer membrane protein